MTTMLAGKGTVLSIDPVLVLLGTGETLEVYANMRDLPAWFQVGAEIELDYRLTKPDAAETDAHNG